MNIFKNGLDLHGDPKEIFNIIFTQESPLGFSNYEQTLTDKPISTQWDLIICRPDSEFVTLTLKFKRFLKQFSSYQLLF